MDATHGGLCNVNMIHHVLINRFVFIYVFFFTYGYLFFFIVVLCIRKIKVKLSITPVGDICRILIFYSSR